MIFTPFYMPLVGIAFMLTFTFMSGFPMEYKLVLVTTVYLTTVFIPTLLIYLYRRFRGWTLQQLGVKHHRLVPYAISLFCYMLCIWLMNAAHVHRNIISIVIAALMIQVACVLVNIWWKISTHTAAIGGVSGALVAFGFILNYNPVWWLCLSILMSGVVGTSRIILRQHSTAQVVAGYFVGGISAFFSIFYF